RARLWPGFMRQYGTFPEQRPPAAAAVTDSPFPLEPTPEAAQAAIRDAFAFFADWSERYQSLIDLGRKLPGFPDEAPTEDNRLHGCHSMVWIVAYGDASLLDVASCSNTASV